MPKAHTTALLGFIHNLKQVEEVRRVSDRDLLRRFIGKRDEASFRALVRRHGAMVFRVCLRVLQREQDAEDAFQATFLVLAKKAGAVQRQDSVGSWLFGVAYRLARKMKATLARSHARHRQATQRGCADPLAELSVREAQELVDGEVGRLPEKYRGPLVLCCLEGATRDEAAQQLGLTLSTVKERLELGRELLRNRLRRRGLTLTGALVASFLGEATASAALPAALLDSTVKAATDELLPLRLRERTCDFAGKDGRSDQLVDCILEVGAQLQGLARVGARKDPAQRGGGVKDVPHDSSSARSN
jgi:RNA polymerase sigma factor (sigma-70 family)